jgi:hypothetical protein
MEVLSWLQNEMPHPSRAASLTFIKTAGTGIRGEHFQP